MYNEEYANDNVRDELVTGINMMIESVLSIVAVIMEKNVIHNKSNIMDREIKLFLLNGDTVDTSLNIGQKSPV